MHLMVCLYITLDLLVSQLIMSTSDSKLIRPKISLQPDYLAFQDLHDSLRQNKGYKICNLKCQNM